MLLRAASYLHDPLEETQQRKHFMNHLIREHLQQRWPTVIGTRAAEMKNLKHGRWRTLTLCM